MIELSGWRRPLKKRIAIPVALFVLVALYACSRYHFLLFHHLAEVFSIIIACGIFMVTWNSRRFLDNPYLLFIGVAYLFVGSLDLMHTLSYKGMNILPQYGANTPTQFWIAARYLESLSFLTAPLTFRRSSRPEWYLFVHGLVLSLVLLSILYWRIFPACFVEGGGLTPFKIFSEYVICLLFLSSGMAILKYRHRFDPSVVRWLLVSVILKALSEISFTHYVNVYGPANLLGHYLKIISFYCVYKAIIETGLAKPYELLFRDLKQSKERYHSLFVNMIDGFATHEMIYDANGKAVDYRFLEVNNAFERLTGLKDVVGRRATEVLPGLAEDRTDWIGLYGQVVATGKMLRFESYAAPLKKWYAVSAFRPAKGQFAAIFEDITERRHAQSALLASEARFRLLSDTAGRLLATEKPEALIEDLCREVMDHLDCQAFFNYLTDESAGRLYLNAAAGIPAERVAEIETLDYGTGVCGCVARDRQRIVVADILNRPDDRTDLIRSFGIRAYCCHPLLVQNRLIGTLSFGTTDRASFAPEEVEIMRTFADQVALAMQRVQTQQSLRVANKGLEEEVLERTAVLAQTVETLQEEVELRTQAENELKMANKELAERAGQLRALAGELTMAEHRERMRLSQILHDGLQQHMAIAKLQLGGMQGRIKDENLKKTAEEIEAIIGESIQMSRSLSADLSPPVLYERGLQGGMEWLARWMRDKHGFSVELIIEPVTELPRDVTVLVFESVRELLFNAVKHAEVSWARVSLAPMDGGGACIAVSDKGAGFEVDALKPAGGDGGGFGLFSIRERISLIGGGFEIYSTPGKGSRFVLKIPSGKSEPAPVRGEIPPTQSIPEGTEREDAGESDPAIRVLITDDHSLFRDGVTRVINQETDIRVVGQARDGAEAFDLTRKLLPDVILMDINMPGVNGIEATRSILREFPGIRIIGLSMHEDPDHAQAITDAGAVGYRTKGCAVSELVSAIRASVNQKPGGMMPMTSK